MFLSELNPKSTSSHPRAYEMKHFAANGADTFPLIASGYWRLHLWIKMSQESLMLENESSVGINHSPPPLGFLLVKIAMTDLV